MLKFLISKLRNSDCDFQLHTISQEEQENSIRFQEQRIFAFLNSYDKHT